MTDQIDLDALEKLRLALVDEWSSHNAQGLPSCPCFMCKQGSRLVEQAIDELKAARERVEELEEVVRDGVEQLDSGVIWDAEWTHKARQALKGQDDE
jgi:hypothetical protein